MTITHTALGRTDSFEVVEKVPAGYVIWNIGDNMEDGYLPFAMLKPGTYEIRPETLKAVALPADELSLLRKLAGRGIDSRKAALRIATRGSRRVTAEAAAKAFEILSRITE